VESTADTRLGPARQRVAVAKLVLAGTGAAAFLVAAGLARVGYPGHHKRATKALSPPSRFVRVVRQNQLQSGILAPAQADPSVATAPT
jgi:hypothetical protein